MRLEEEEDLHLDNSALEVEGRRTLREVDLGVVGHRNCNRDPHRPRPYAPSISKPQCLLSRL